MEFESGATTTTTTTTAASRSSKADRRHRTKLKLKLNSRPLCQRDNKLKTTPSKTTTTKQEIVAQTTAGGAQRRAPLKEPQLNALALPTPQTAKRGSGELETVAAQVTAIGRETRKEEGEEGGEEKEEGEEKEIPQRGIYFHRIDHHGKQEEEEDMGENCQASRRRQTRRRSRRKGRRRRARHGGDPEWPRGTATRLAPGRRHCCQLRPMTLASSSSSVLCWLGVLAPLIIIIGSLEMSLMLISTQANCQTIELGEGLTLNQNNGNNRHSSSSVADLERQQQQQHEWPLQHLERIKTESRVSAVLGQNVVLNCAVEFPGGQEKPFVVNWLKYPHKLPIYIWYAGYPPHVAQGYESRVTRIGQASLNLTSVRESDKGLYECKIYYLDRRPEDKTNGTWIYLDVQAPPHWIEKPPPISYVQAGDSLHLTCQAQSTPAPKLLWYKNKVPIDSDAGPYRLSSSTGQTFPFHSQQQQKANNNNAPANGQVVVTDKQLAKQLDNGQNIAQLDLFIDNVQAGQTTGDYVCMASNLEGTIEARSQVVLAVPAVITTWPRNQTRLEGERVELLCQAKALPANITYKWLFNNKPLQQLKWFDSRYTQKRDGTLVIHSLHRDDQGEYKCQATNGLSHRSRLIGGGAGDEVGAGGMGEGGGNSRGVTGSPIKTANSNNNNNDNNHQLATTTTSAAAPIYAEAAAYLSVEFPARVTYSPPVQYLPLGMPGQIRCYVQSVPPVEFFTWTLNNQQFDPNTDANIERLQNGSLLIKQVNESYEGQYRCTPFNKHGSAGSSAAMEVRVQEPPQFVSRPEDFYKANLNGQIKIPCDGRGSPKPNVSWRRVIQVPRKAAAHHNQHDLNNNNAPEPGADRGHSNNQRYYENNNNQSNRLKREPRQFRIGSGGGGSDRVNGVNGGVKALTSGESATTRHFHSANQHQTAHLAYDEAADEPDETHHFYATTVATSQHQDQPGDGNSGGGSAPASPMLLDGQTTDNVGSSNNNNNNAIAANQDETNQQQQQSQEQEQQTVIVYSKLPSDRSEYKNSYLHLHNLRKEDHGRYECVIENEVATLVASTMLYIEETTPHAPTDVRVDTKVWSAQVSWTPGYDGGFEQSFVVWYRQVDRPKQHQQSHHSSSSSPSSAAGGEMGANSQQLNDVIDVNWHSQNVQSSDATSLIVQNLSQDTTYEFYVRAKNIIGEGPRSQVIQATTKRAIMGSVTPISPVLGGPETIAASTVAGIGDDLNSSKRPNYEPANNEDDTEPATVTSPTSSIRPYLIIHPEYVSPPISLATSNANNASNQFQTGGSSRTNNNNNQIDGSQHTQFQSTNHQGADTNETGDLPTTMSSNKVIKIYFPSQNNKQHSQQQSNGTDSSVSPPTIVGKRTSIDQSEQSSSNSNNNSNNNSHLPQAQADQSTAPRNVSMMKVAQGWVLSWAPPQRLPNPASSFGDEHAEAIHQSPTGSNNNNGGAMSQQQQADEQVPNTGADTSSSPSSPGHLLQDPMKGSSLPSISKDQRRGQLDTEQQQPFVYSIELKEKNSTVWQAFGSSREPSLLLKDLRAGGDYQFRVIAHTANGLKGAPSAEFRYFIPDNKRKPGLTQAFSATVTSGLLFFIACIVIAVCGVNMCNKRRKKRAEKAAYVMMACPVLESHHDIAALNSNSLLKNSATNAPQDRVPGLSSIGQQRHQNGAPTNEHAHHLTGHSLRLASSLTARNDEHQGSEQNRVPTTNKRLSKDRLKLSINSSGTPHLDRRLVDFLQKVLFGRKSANESTQEANSYNHHHLPSCQQTGAGVCRDAPMLEEREINFSSNEPFPVDVDPIEKFLNNQSNPDNQREQQQRPLDDYWVRQPSDRKWGTLTLAASKLAERRAAANEARREQRASDVTDLSIDRLQQQQQQQHHEPHPKRGSLEFTGNLTLPRSFKTHLGPSSRLKATTTATISSNNNNNNSASTSPPRVPPRIATQKPQLPAPIPPPKDTQLGASNNNQNTQQIDHQFTSAQMHRRSISHIEAKSGSLANHRQSSLATRDGLQLQLQSLTHNWPQTAWTQQDLCDWASMSFGPPVSSFQQQASEQQAAAWPVVPPPVTCSSTQVYKSSATIDAPFNQWASGHHHHQQQQQQQYNSFNYTASTMQMHNPQEQQQLRDQNDRDNSQPMSSSMKRNSLARSTLPMMAPITSSSFNQSILAPPYNPAHDQQAFTIQQRQPLLVCPFYPSVPTVLPPLLSSYGARRELDIGQLKQVTAATSTGNHLEYNGQAAVDHHHTFNDNDDPLTENACLGSYKRKRRLPHIEAQFTMTKLPGPELPPKDVDDHSRIVSQSQRRQASRQPFHTRTNSSIFGQQQDCSSTTTTRFRSLSESEQHPHNMQSYEPETGGLFVRDATCVETFAGPKSYTTTTGGRGGDNGGLTVVAHRSPPPPPGMPQSGQRTEQRLLRESTSLELASLGRGGVDKSNVIDANEKIATYLRSHQHQVSLPVSSNSNTTTNPSGGPQLRPPNSITLSSNLSSPSSSTSSNDSPVELDQVDEITFQPYYNMPSLKYTISLPVRQTQNGRLVLEPSSNLRPKRRAGGSGGSYRRSSRSSTLASFSELQHTARHLGSNSSCPVEPPADSEHRDADSRPQPPTPPPLPPQPPSLPARISINTTASFTVNERQRDNIQTDNSRMTMIQRNSNVTLEANANNNTSSGSSNGANDKGFQLKNATTAAYAEIYSSVHEEELEQGQASVSVSPTNRETNCRGSSFGKSEAPPVPPHRTQQSGLLAGKLDETQAATRVPPPPQFGCHRQKKAIHQVSSSETNKTDEALELEGAPHVLEERAANYGRGRRESVTTTTTGAGACAPTSSAISPVDSSAASNSSTTSSSSCTSSASVPASSSSSEPTTLSGGRNSGSSGGPISHHARRHGFDEERQPDQSVDESYEFDHASSSCSSSLRASERQNRRRRRKRQSGAPQAEPQPDEETITGATVKEHREKRANSGADDDQRQASLSIKLLANNESKRVVEDVVVVYGRVDKSKKRHRVPLGGDKSLLEQPKQQQQQPTTNFVGVVERARFYDCTRQMEKTLVLAAGNRHPSALSPPLRLMAHTGMQRNTASSSSPAHDDDDRITERRRNEEETRVCSMNTTSDNIIANSTHATNTSTNTTTTATSMNQRSASPGVPNHAHHHYDTVYDAMLTSQRQDGRP